MNHFNIYCKDIATPAFENKVDFTLNGGIHTWQADVKFHTVSLPYFESVLTQQEYNYCNRFIQESDRTNATVRKAILKILCSRYLNCPIHEIVVAKGINNKPYIMGAPGFYINSSHSHSAIMLAFADTNVGIDVEYTDAGFDYTSLTSEIFTAGEINRITSASDPLRSFYTHWTRKEALLKATGIGIVDHLNCFSCMDEKNTNNHPKIISDSDWWISSFNAGENYIAGIAINNKRMPSFINFGSDFFV